MNDHVSSINEYLLFCKRITQLSKALWKTIEKDWQQWIKPFDLNINEHHILWISYHLKGASISDVAKFGVMHVSTAFNFSKKLEERGLLEFSKKENDKRNTYIQLTDKGKDIFEQSLKAFNPENSSIMHGTMPLHDLYGKFPDLIELTTMIRNIYGTDFMSIIDNVSIDNNDEKHDAIEQK
ncbi:HTH-type transcriptional regulator Hpr [Heyndrickxia ginsengihumi]|uniref:Transcriptional regulator n=1 Tax=Heyndrickxia ginsengihumi TaxID=363870 RepID=A0A0A6Y0Q7_9BACI|nr:HTH-type transcriptional regulator Hpr [Heyndrickxia ginsengihumi]KHD85877.1 transcriptional regulator [Heyndrickxia ginsengihumi]MBE6185638.1 HTH-type transcriptional regulator Hpr [Bacillus sp. (in: firmicutes)]MCM3023625.1 HTH-type transcriptional regulator Hpr [Heyndrickxia ginsengihumi]NEY18890.1 HTH-type transcriptional regulator Hpr [Heyndrickxia ginsengihumi]